MLSGKGSPWYRASLLARRHLKKDIFAISELYSEHGYALITVTPDLIPDESKKLVKIALKIDEGDQV